MRETKSRANSDSNISNFVNIQIVSDVMSTNAREYQD